MEIDEQQLLRDLDQLAGISGVEQFHRAELPELRRLAHVLTGQPETRTGRYAAVRDAIGDAIEHIEDTAFSDAAFALLGHQDRWRSARDRGTDAGRAFTPNVSYDSFRRKSGRNYRTNTLRMVADGLLKSLSKNTSRGEQIKPDQPSPATVEDPSTTSQSSAEPRRSRPLVLALAAVALFGLAGVAIWNLATGDPRATNVAEEDVTTPTISTPDAEMLGPDATDPSSPEPSEASPRIAFGEVDITRHCRSLVQDRDDLFAVRNNEFEGGWACSTLDGGTVAVPSFADACNEQYGPLAGAELALDWRCVIDITDLRFPDEPRSLPDGCSIPVGAHDRDALSQFERYSTRFVEAFLAHDLPEDVCAGTPLHFYGDPGDSGVTQFLVRDEEPIGALVADDPLNVVVLTDEAWKAYAAVRGLAIYQLGFDVLEDRVGYPVGAARETGGIWRLDLTGGGALVSPTTDGEFIWMPKIALEVWEAYGGTEGCLGMPTRSPLTDASATPEQQFENAVVGIDVATGSFYLHPEGIC